MTEELPPPPVPAGTDLTRLEYMPLVIAKLRRSASWLRAKRRPEVGFYMVNLWTAAWMETPAGSLTNDDDILADAAMCSPEKWDEVKSDALRGFRLYSDGRLYHGFLVECVLDALEKREKWRLKKKGQRGDTNKSPLNVPGDTRGETTLTGIDGNGRESPPTPQSDPLANPDAAAVVDEFLRLRIALWPQESGFPAPTMTLKTQAAQYLAAGAPRQLVIEIIERVMRQNLAKGDRAPRSLQFCHLTMETATRNHLKDIPVAARVDAGKPSALTPEQQRAYYRDIENYLKLPAAERAGKKKPVPKDYIGRPTEAA